MTNASSAVTSNGMHASLSGTTHTPIANKNFGYTVVARDASGRPLAGTVDTEFAFSGVVVGHESPPTHRLKNGVLRDYVSFPSRAIGEPIELQTVVHTAKGTVTLDWPITTRP